MRIFASALLYSQPGKVVPQGCFYSSGVMFLLRTASGEAFRSTDERPTPPLCYLQYITQVSQLEYPADCYVALLVHCLIFFLQVLRSPSSYTKIQVISAGSYSEQHPHSLYLEAEQLLSLEYLAKTSSTFVYTLHSLPSPFPLLHKQGV